MLPESDASQLLEHCIRCDACELLFRQAMQDLSDEATETERSYLGALKSAQPEWQLSLGERLSKEQSNSGGTRKTTSLVGHRTRSFADRFSLATRMRLGYAWAYTAAAILLVGAVAWFWETRREPSVDQLIVSAYVEERPFELRMAGAGYGPVRQQRGGQGSAFAIPTDLLKAKYLIKERLAARPNDQSMLIASGRVELLEGHYDEAIRTFGRLLDAQPDSPTVLTDLATAHFQRAETTNRAIDYGQTIELLGRALGKNPDDQVALFNRAIALQKMFAYDEAIRDWDHYLRVDPKGSWADEARWRLSELQEEIKARDRPLALLQSNPVTAAPLLRVRASGQSTFPTPWPVSFDEEYLDLAVQQWLASLYVSADSAGQHVWTRRQSVWEALAAEANVLSTQHNDPWLSDLLRDSPADLAATITAEPFVKALDLLAQSATANAAGDPDAARPLAESAARYFQIAKSDAGYLRAREEVLYSTVRAGKIKDCLQVVHRQLREPKLELYPWLNGQALQWNAACEGFAGNLDFAQRLSDNALEFTKATRYSGQRLRSVLFASGFLRSTDRHWQETCDGLQSFWTEMQNPFHGYEFYMELALLAEEAEQRYLTLNLWREALAMIERTPDLSFRAVAHYHVAVAAMKIQDMFEAETEFRAAKEQFAAVSPSTTSQFYLALAEIQWAAVAVQQGQLEMAAARLEQARPLLATVSDPENAFRYYRTLGELQFRRGKLPEAEQALWNALNFAEVELNSLQTDSDRLAWEGDSSPAYRALVDLYARKPEDSIRALEVWETYLASPVRKSMLSPAVSKHNRENSDFDRNFQSLVRAALPAFKHETVISFASLPSGAAAWAFDDRGVNFSWLAASNEDLAAHIRRFEHLCADPYSDLSVLQQEGRSLYNFLLGPFERYLEPGRLLILEPDTVFNNVPWLALVNSREQYLGSQFTIVISPGVGYWLRLRPSSWISPEKTALVVGMPTMASAVASRFAPLPDADHEAQDVASRFQHSHVLSGAGVTSVAIRQELPRSDVFHFAGHAVSGVKQSGLVLASVSEPPEDNYEPSLLSASELNRTKLQRLQLVVLSACATAETEKGFVGPDSLVRDFLGAGVPHVVASRWPVDSLSTKLMMAEFYSRLLTRLSVGQALGQAAGRLRLQSATAHPYYWAAFNSYGR
jgi:CHAT domain-containing protein/tetratricopeptide (TPR) repeat protein